MCVGVLVCVGACTFLQMMNSDWLPSESSSDWFPVEVYCLIDWLFDLRLMIMKIRPTRTIIIMIRETIVTVPITGLRNNDVIPRSSGGTYSGGEIKSCKSLTVIGPTVSTTSPFGVRSSLISLLSI